jgi:hypothetical protein
MKETERIADQLKRAFTGEAWHGPAVLEILSGITAQQATAHPLVGRHSIWNLCFTLRPGLALFSEGCTAIELS